MRTPPSWSRHYRRVDWKSSTAPATFRRSSFPIPSTKCCGTSLAEPTRASERFRAKTCPGLDPGWTPVRLKKTRQMKKQRLRSDSIGTEALHLEGVFLIGRVDGAPPGAMKLLQHLLGGGAARIDDPFQRIKMTAL